jgi:hypothetical protein
MQRLAVSAWLLLAVLLVAACGGGSAASPDGDPSAGTVDPSAAPATEGAAATEPATGGAAATDPATGGGGASGPPCDLATADELTGAMGVPVTTHFDPNAATTCFVNTGDGATIAHWTLTDGGPAVFDAITAGGTDVSGIGDRARHVENFGLMIVKGDDIVTIVIPGGANMDSEAARAAAEKVGAIVAGRM